LLITCFITFAALYVLRDACRNSSCDYCGSGGSDSVGVCDTCGRLSVVDTRKQIPYTLSVVIIAYTTYNLDCGPCTRCVFVAFDDNFDA
jgi:hypothetical protein